MSSTAEFKWDEMVILDDLVASGEVQLGRGNVISKIDIRNTPGPYPIYSSSSKNNGKMGEYGQYMFDEELISWSVDGGGYFFHRPKHKFSVTNVSGFMRLGSDWDYRFTAYFLQFQHEYFSFDYQTKAHPSVIREFYLFPRILLPEQKKIASILSSVDDVIEKTRTQIDKLKHLKTGMMQELLTKGIGPDGKPHTEFKDSPVGRIPEGWNVKSLGNLADFINGNGFKATDWTTTGLPIIRIQNLNGDGSFNYYSKEVNPKWLVETGDLLFAWSGQRGKSFGARIWKGAKGVLNQHIFRVGVNDVLVTKPYLHLLMQQVQVDIERHAHGFKDSFMHVKKSDLVSQEVAVPPLNEQKRIVSIFDSLSEKLELSQTKLEKLLDSKKALMQDLLSGKVRVKLDDKESAAA